MNDSAHIADVLVLPDQRERVFKLYDDGQYLQAYRLTESVGPLASWRGTEARILAARLAANLGSMRLADWHFVHAWRSDRRHPEAMWFFARYLLASRGPLAAWKFVNEHSIPADARQDLQSHWCSQRAAILGRLRDFDAAEAWLRKAETFGAHAWTCLEWAVFYMLDDRHDEAEAAARKAMQLHPWYRPAVQWVAHFLVQRERDDEALDLLTQATKRLESGAVLMQLANLQMELSRDDDAARSLDEVERLSPLMDKHLQLWLHARRCDLACRTGDYDKAIEHAKNAVGKDKKTKAKFYENLVPLLANRSGPGKRVVIPVRFVRQHHGTCAPATLVAIARFWSMPAEHLEVAADISYAGTPHHGQRTWAHEHGWYAKEFTVSWDSAVALIERGIPFTLTTAEATSAHLQAVIGYDSLRRTLILRDPGERHQVEMAFDAMLERYRSTGPRGMALTPIALKDKLESLALPDEALYDHLFRMEVALKEHRRDDAGNAAQAIAAQAPAHFLTAQAKRTLAFYDTDLPAELTHVERLLELFPGDLHLELVRANLLSVMGRYAQRLELLKRLAERKETDPACWQQYALELSADARQHPQALYLLRKAARANPLLARTYATLARIRSSQRKFDEALQLYHFAACLEEKDEFHAQDYVMEARAQGKAEEALQFLKNRFERLGARSSQPARTFYLALTQQGRYGDALDVLERAMKLRPGDGELLTYGAEANLYRGDFARALEILQKAKGISKPAARFRSLALVAAYQGDSMLAREYWEEVLKIEPIAEDAHRAYCLLLGEREGRESVIKHLEAVCNRFPHHFNLNHLLLDWQLEDGPAVREKSLQRLIDIHPANAATRIEYAYNLGDQDRIDAAHQQLDEAESLDPHAPAIWHARGMLHKKKNRTDDAQYAFREAVRRSVDFEAAIQELIGFCENLTDRRDVVAFVVGELLRQRTFGGGARALAFAAQPGIPPQELLAHLQRVRDAHSNLWSLWQVVARHAGYCERNDERLALVQDAVRQFPAVSELWVELGEVQRIHWNTDAELRAHQRALELAPNSVLAIRTLAEAHERARNIEQAKSVFEQAIRRAPLVSDTYVEYAALLFRCGAHDEAVKQAKQALQLDPWFEHAWSSLGNWCIQLGRVDDLIELAREWTRSRPGNWRSWFRLGQAIQARGPCANEAEESKRLDECAAAYREAIKRNPLGVEFYDARNPFPRDLHDCHAEMFGVAARYDAALEACTPAALNGKPPVNLRGRAAWVLAMKGDYEAAKEQMARLLKENRAYQWGWSNLVAWCMATHDFKAYHDAANDMLRAYPQSAVALAYRGEALMHMDDRAAGKEDLRAALRKDPCLQLCTFVLFDEQLADDDLVGAEATLLSMQENIAGTHVGARPIQFHARRGNQETALRLFKDLCNGTFPPPNSLETAMRALDLAGWKGQAEEIVGDAMQAPQWNIQLAILYASYWNPNQANDLPDRIAAIDRALERTPGTFRYLDLKAELLAGGNQFQRAWQTCQEKTFPVDQYRLDGRAAWVLFRSGRVDEAFAAMRELVKQHPKYDWGWIQLADWCGRQQQWVEVLTAAEQLVQILPRDPTGYAFRGQAKQNLGDPQAARADYVLALDMHPGHLFAAWPLFDLYVRGGEWQRAEKLLEKAKKYADKGDWALRKVEMCIYQNKKTQFPAEFESLLRHSARAPWLIDHSLQFIVQAGWWSDAEEVLRRCLELGPHICDPWVRLRVSMEDRSVGSDIQSMDASRPERTNCIAAFAIELAKGQDKDGLRRWILTHEDCLRASTPCWSKVAFALSLVEDWTGIVEWLSDWSEHPDALPGMLILLVRAHRSFGEFEEARRVSEHAMTKLNTDYATSFHQVWLTFDQALNGEIVPVQRYLETYDMGGFDAYHQFVASMVLALSLTMTDKVNGFEQARQVLFDAAKWGQPTAADPALRRAYRACIAEMARLHGTLGAMLWRWWRWLMPKLPAKPKSP